MFHFLVGEEGVSTKTQSSFQFGGGGRNELGVWGRREGLLLPETSELALSVHLQQQVDLHDPVWEHTRNS